MDETDVSNHLEPKTIAALTGKTLKTVWLWIDAGLLKPVPCGGGPKRRRVKIPRSEYQRFLAESGRREK